MLRRTPEAKKILRAPPEVQSAVVMRAIRDLGALRAGISGSAPGDLFNVHFEKGYSNRAMNFLGALLIPRLQLEDAEVVSALAEIARYEHIAIDTMPFLPALFKYLDRRSAGAGLPSEARPDAKKIAKALRTMEGAAETRLSKRFAALAKARGAIARRSALLSGRSSGTL
jgi:hypothetical protein